MTEPTAIPIGPILAKLDAHFSPEAEDGWIAHDGNGRPHPPGTYVEIEMRSGKFQKSMSAFFPWVWEDEEGYDNSKDIIRWRPRRQPLSEKELAETVPALLAHIRATTPIV